MLKSLNISYSNIFEFCPYFFKLKIYRSEPVKFIQRWIFKTDAIEISLKSFESRSEVYHSYETGLPSTAVYQYVLYCEFV